ncbi:MAG: PilN family type IVB pilus formation outer membrane protein [Luteimonas sp.]
MRPFLSAFIVTALLGGCTTAENIRRNDFDFRDNTADAEVALSTIRNGKPAVEPGGIRILDDQTYIATRPTILDRNQTLPRRCNITFAPASSVTLLEFGQTVTKVCGIPVRVTPDALAATNDGGYGSSTMPNSASGALTPIPLPPGASLPPPVSGGYGGMNSMPTQLSPNRIDIRYSGELTGLLNAVSSRLGLSWRYRDGVVSMFYLDTRFFKVYSIPTTTSMDSVVASGTATSAGVQGGTGGGGNGGGAGGISGSSSSSQTTNVSLRTNSTDDLTKTVASMLTPNVGRMSLSPSSGNVTVTDTPEVLDRIGSYINDLNTFATKQVLLNIKILSVQVNDSDELGINWDVIYQSLSSQYGIGLVSSFANSADAISGSVNILEGSSRFSGSQLVVNALSKQGRVSVLTQPSVTTLNLEPVPVQIAKQTSYLAQSSTTLSPNVGSTTSLTPGTVTTGFNMNLLPYILPDSQTILLQYSLNLSSLSSIRRVESGESAIEIPEVDNRILSQKVRMRSGETLVLSGFEQSTKGNDRSGTGSPRFWLFGGGVRATNAREVLVVLITPIVTI